MFNLFSFNMGLIEDHEVRGCLILDDLAAQLADDDHRNVSHLAAILLLVRRHFVLGWLRAHFEDIEAEFLVFENAPLEFEHDLVDTQLW